jgi:putative DNA primase/helicase
LKALVPGALMFSHATGAAMFRLIDEWHPTLLVDEADSFLSNSEPLRGLFNSGHDRPRTLQDRSIVISLRRRLPEEKVISLRGQLHEIKTAGRRAARWAQDNVEALRQRDPPLPEDMHDRDKDNWQALLAIADLIGADWPAKARKAAIALSTSALGQQDPSDGVRLLADVRGVFEQAGGKELRSKEMIKQLRSDDGYWITDKRLTQKALAHLLAPYGIHSKQATSGPAKGRMVYERDDFEDAWQRYAAAKNPFRKPGYPGCLEDKKQLGVRSPAAIALQYGENEAVEGVEI